MAAAAEAASLAQAIEEYLADHPAATLLEDGRVLFDMRTAHYAVTEAHGRCLLQLWSEERNLVRTVVDVQERAQCLRLTTRRMGAAKAQSLELTPTSDRRTPTARDAARRAAAERARVGLAPPAQRQQQDFDVDRRKALRRRRGADQERLRLVGERNDDLGDLGAGVMGAVWIAARIVYAIAYQRDPAKRSAGFGIAFLAFAGLWAGALWGVVKVLMH